MSTYQRSRAQWADAVPIKLLKAWRQGLAIFIVGLALCCGIGDHAPTDALAQQSDANLLNKPPATTDPIDPAKISGLPQDTLLIKLSNENVTDPPTAPDSAAGLFSALALNDKMTQASQTDLTPSDKGLFELLNQISELEKTDPCAPQLKAMTAQLQRALSGTDYHSRSDPNADLTKPPSAQQKIDEMSATSGTPDETSATGAAKEIKPPRTRNGPPAVPGSENTGQPRFQGIPGGIRRGRPPRDGRPNTPDAKAAEPQAAHTPKAPQPPTPAAAAAAPTLNDNLIELVTATPEIQTPATPTTPPSPNDIVKINVKNDMLEISMLIETVGKELKFTFLYHDAKGVTGNVKLQQFGEIRRRDLLPLLESVLGFQQLAMIRQDPFIRIVKHPEVLKKTDLRINLDDELPELESGDMIVAQMLELKYVDTNVVKGLLAHFTEGLAIVDIPNSSYIIITEYASRLPRLLEMVDMIDQPGPPKRLEVLSVEYLKANEIQKTISTLMQAMAKEMITSGPAKAAAPAAKPKRPTRAQAAAKRGTPVTAATSAAPFFYADDRTNRLFVIGTDEQIDEVQHLAFLLDVDIDDIEEVDLASIQISHVAVADLVKPLKDLYTALAPEEGAGNAPAATTGKQQTTTRPRPRRDGAAAGSRAGKTGPFLLPLETTNTLLVVGTEEQMELLDELIDILDVLPNEFGGVPRLEIYRPLFVEVAEARKIMDDLGITKKERLTPRDRARGVTTKTPARTDSQDETPLPGAEEFEIRLALQEDLNKMFVFATEAQHKSIVQILEQIDEEPNELIGAIQIYPLENREPEDVASMLESLLESETTGADDKKIPGKEGAPIIVALADIYAVAVRASVKQHKEIADIIKVLDKRLPQVLVEAILIQVSGDDGLNLGVSLQDSWDVAQTRSGRSRRVSGSSPFGVSPQLNADNTMVFGTGGVLAFFTDNQVYATLEALQQQGNTKVVSKPRILVNDNEDAEIDSREEQPTTKTTIPAGSDTPIIEFKEYVTAGTKLSITPHISEGDFLQLTINLNVESFGDTVNENVPPEKFSNNLATLVTVPNGKTIILGGLTTQSNALTVKKIPLLGDIPLIGALFQNVSRTDARNVLYVFVRAHIIRSIDEHGDFSDLDTLSDYYRKKLEVEETGAREQTIIPGLAPEKPRWDDAGALSGWYDPNEPETHNNKFPRFDDD